MTIDFNIADELGAQYLAAVRWKIDRPDLTDDKIMKKFLKQKICELVEEHKRFVFIGSEQTPLTDSIKAVQEQAMTARRQLVEADTLYKTKLTEFNALNTPVDVGPD